MTCPNLEALRIFPGSSRFGKCDSSGGKPQRLHSNRLPPACCPFCQADRHRLSGQNGNGLKSCGSHMGLSAICSANRDKSPSAASRSTESALRIFPSFSWSGKCDSRERKRVGALKVRYPSELVRCGRSHAQRINAQEVRWRGMMVEFWAKNLRKPTVYG